MSKPIDEHLSRREFLRLATIGAGTLAVSSGSAVFGSQALAGGNPAKNKPRLNPGFRVREISRDEIELYTNLANGETLRHRFSGLEADLFREISRERTIDEMVVDLSKNHNLSVKACREQLTALLHEHEQARIVYYGSKMLVKVVRKDG
jgi:hypothetical protein